MVVVTVVGYQNIHLGVIDWRPPNLNDFTSNNDWSVFTLLPTFAKAQLRLVEARVSLFANQSCLPSFTIQELARDIRCSRLLINARFVSLLTWLNLSLDAISGWLVRDSG